MKSLTMMWQKTDLTFVQLHEIIVMILVCWQAVPSSFSLILGGGMSLVGLLIRVWTSGYPRQWDRFEVFGPYRFVRHPYHLGSFLLLLGFCLAGRSGWVTGFMIAGAGLIFRSIMQEEDLRRDESGDRHFLDYKIQVSSFLPNLLPYPVVGGYNKPFSFSYAFLKGERRELDTMILMIVGYGLLYGFMQVSSGRTIQMGIAALLALVLFGRLVWPMVKQRAMD